MADSRPATRPLGSLVADHQAGIYKHRSQYGEGYNIVGVADLFRHDAIDGQVFRRARLTQAEAAFYALQQDDLLYAESSLVLEGIAKTLHVTERGKGTAFAWHTRRVRPITSLVDASYLATFLSSVEARRFIMSRATQTVLTGMPVAAYFETPIRLPSLPEQRQIAAVLDTIDDAIRKTEQFIAKLKQVKQGLLHDLLTRGIDDHGELRDPERHPEQFKDSPLGRIPRGWEVANLESISESVTSGSRGWASYYAESGALFIRIGNLTREHINLRFESVQFVRPPLAGEGTRTALVPGDLLVSITADLGIIGVVPQGLGEAYVNQHIARVRVRPEAANSRWLGHYLASHYGRQQVRRLDDAGAKAGLNLPTVRKLLAPRPPREEQDELTDRLDGVDQQVEIECAAQRKLLHLKAGLMEDLLTGRVRVTKLLENAAQ